MSPEQASEKQYPMPSEEKYHGLARTIDQDSEEFDEMAREYLELQMASSKQRAAFLSGVSWQRENGWLAYPENKPVDDNEYLVFTKQGKIKIDEYLPGAQEWYIHDVTHFRPLPPAPASINKQIK